MVQGEYAYYFYLKYLIDKLEPFQFLPDFEARVQQTVVK